MVCIEFATLSNTVRSRSIIVVVVGARLLSTSLVSVVEPFNEKVLRHRDSSIPQPVAS